MAVRSQAYWIERQSQLFNSQLKKDNDFSTKLEKDYQHQQSLIQKDMAEFYAKYGEDNVVKYRDMLQGLTPTERDQFYQQHNQFVLKHPELADVVALDIPIYQMNRFEALELSVKHHMAELGSIEQQAYDNHLGQTYEHGYMKTMENLGNPQAMFGVSDEIIRQTMSQEWVAGRNFSDSIWKNKEGLTNALTTRLRDGFIRGDSYASMTKILEDRFNVGKFEARRLVQTEAAFIMNQANSYAFQQEGIERYSLSAVLDDRTSEVCNTMDGEVFYFKDMRVGENAPPFHAYCRTMIIPVENDVVIEGESEGIIEAFENTNIKDVYGEDIYNSVIGSLDDFQDERVKKMFEMYVDQVGYHKDNTNTAAAVFNQVHMDPRTFNSSSVAKLNELFFHETGHAIDNIALTKFTGAKEYETGKSKWRKLGRRQIEIKEKVANYSALDKFNLNKTIKQDLWNHAQKDTLTKAAYKKTIGKQPTDHAEFMAWSRKELDHSKLISSNWNSFKDDMLKLKDKDTTIVANLSDIVESTGTLGQAPFGAGHGKKYWKEKGNAEAEFFAEMTSSIAVNKESYELMKEVFPNATKTYFNIVEELIKEGG